MEILKLYTGEIEPNKTDTRDKRRMFLDEVESNDVNNLIKFFEDNKILIIADIITKKGNLKIGQVTCQRKGGDGGRDSAKMLQFKINPAILVK